MLLPRDEDKTDVKFTNRLGTTVMLLATDVSVDNGVCLIQSVHSHVNANDASKRETLP